MTTCNHPGCNARVMREGPCSRHRPRKPHTRTRDQRARESQREAERYRRNVAKCTAGLPAGWEAA